MNPVLSLMGNIAFAAATVVSVFSVATKLSASEPALSALPSAYAGDLWTSVPTVVDTNAQHFERIPGVDTTSIEARTRTAVPSTQVASLDPTIGISGETSTSNPVMAADHEQWCASHYRSFDPRNNTYRSFSGQTRLCVSPFATYKTPTVSGTASLAAQATYADVEACTRRYRSYDPTDHTYQPLEGGPRRVCFLTK